MGIPKKHLGQNFLADQGVQRKIVDSCDLTLQDTVVEIGSGRGALTHLIAPKVKRLVCVETDRDLILTLTQEFVGTHAEIVHADFLKWDMSPLGGNLKVIGNIPYYISTPIIEKLIENRCRISSAYLTVQLEFGKRLCAPAGGKEYGALSCFAQYHAEIKVLFKIRAGCFKPVPKVDSCFVKMDFSRGIIDHPKDEEFLFRLIRTAFAQRRKTILNALEPMGIKETLTCVLRELGIPLKSRPEQLPLPAFVDISNKILELKP